MPPTGQSLTFKKVLFPTDLSRWSSKTLCYAARLARKFGSELYLLHVADGGSSRNGSAFFRNNLRHEMELLGDGCLQDLPVTRLIAFGGAASSIAECVREKQIDLVVMPTYGGGTFRQLFLGSVVSKVLREVECPVWTTAHTDDPKMRLVSEVRTIVCALDTDESAREVLMTAIGVAAHFVAALRLVHAIPVFDVDPGGVIEDAPFQQFLVQTAREKIRRLQSECGVRLEAEVVQGDVASVIRDCAATNGADLVVTGRGHSNEVLAPMRSDLFSIIQKSPCPVLSLGHGATWPQTEAP